VKSTARPKCDIRPDEPKEEQYANSWNAHKKGQLSSPADERKVGHITKEEEVKRER